MRITKKIVILLFCCLSALGVYAQGYTYHHDNDVWQQFNALEAVGYIPTGFMWDLHPNYTNMAATPPYGARFTSRALFLGYLSKEVKHADDMDSLYTSRLKNLVQETGDRVVDAQWVSEGGRIEKQLEIFEHNIGLISSYGGSPEDYSYWKTVYNMIAKNAIPMVREAYQPGYKRMEEYQNIFNDLQEQNKTLLVNFRKWKAQKEARWFAENNTYTYHSRLDSIAAVCMGRWRMEAGEANSASPKPKQLEDVWSE